MSTRLRSIWQGSTLKENWLSLSQQSTSVSSSSVRSETSCTPPISMLGFNLAWACKILVCVVTTAVSSCVHVPCCVRKVLFPCSYPPPLVLTLFLLPLSQWYLGLWRWACNIDVSFEAECSVVYYSLHNCLGICVICHKLE